MMDQPLKFAVIWTEIPGYMNACLRKMAELYPIELLVISDLGDRSITSRRLFDTGMYSWINEFYEIKDKKSYNRFSKIITLLNQFQPDALMMAFQWRYIEFYGIQRYAHDKKIISVATMDNNWFGSLNQQLITRLNKVFSLINPDYVFVPGERAYQYAKRLFRSETRIGRGLYVADSDTFIAEKFEHSSEGQSFLCVARLVPEKGINQLINAYRIYRLNVKEPWELIIVGDGPLRNDFDTCEGVIFKGFLQPEEIAKIMSTSGVFILPSIFEPWGVSLHEAALMGLPIICSDACGSSVELVQHGFNGFVYSNNHLPDLISHMENFSSGLYDLSELGSNSKVIAKRYTTQLWSQNLFTELIFQLSQQQSNNLFDYRTLFGSRSVKETGIGKSSFKK